MDIAILPLRSLLSFHASSLSGSLTSHPISLFHPRLLQDFCSFLLLSCLLVDYWLNGDPVVLFLSLIQQPLFLAKHWVVRKLTAEKQKSITKMPPVRGAQDRDKILPCSVQAEIAWGTSASYKTDLCYNPGDVVKKVFEPMEDLTGTHSWQWGSCFYWCLSQRRWRPDRGSTLCHPQGHAG